MRYKKPLMVFVALLVASLAMVGVACCPPAAAFEVSNLVVTPTYLGLGEEVAEFLITADVTNVGEVEGTKTINLKVDGVIKDSEEVTLAAGASEEVSFTYVPTEAGTYTIEVDGQTATVTVTEEEVTPTPTATPTPGAYLTYSDSENGFAVDYPAAWEWSDDIVAETENCLAAFVSPTAEDSFYPYFYVTATPDVTYSVSTILAFAPWSTYFPGYSRVSDEATTVDGLDAYIVVFTCDEGEAMQLLVVKENTLWEVVCFTTEGTFDAYEAIFGHIIASFTFLD